MPLRLFFSNSLDSLSEVLREILRLRSRSAGSLFRGPHVIIPNPNVKRWLQLSLARRDGSCFDLGLGEMQEVLSQILNQIGGIESSGGLLSPSEFQLYVFRALCRIMEVVHKPNSDAQIIDTVRYSQDLKPILHYLYGANSKTRYSERHLWQLSIKLAELFQEYYHHRYFELITRWDSWRQSRSIPLSEENALELAQFRVYEMVQILRAQDNVLNGSTGKYLLSELAQLVLGDLRVESAKKAQKVIPDLHIFGLSQIFDFHQLLLSRLAKNISIFVYTFNPCREFWEDVETPFEEYRRKLIQGKRSNLISTRKRISDEENQKGEVDLPEESDIYVLRSWGRPGRENIRLLCELANYDVDWVPGLHIPETVGKDTVLTRLQRQILTRSAREYAYKPPLDNSLQIYACPSIFREIENIRQLILKAILEDPSLSLNEIAILVPSMDTYKPVIEAVLSRRSGEIPFNLVDSTAGEDSFYAQAIFSILEILRLGATRPRLFRLFRNPCYLDRFGLCIDDIEILLDWFDELNALHEKPSAYGSEVVSGASAPFGFHQALKRLRLGLMMESDPSLLGTLVQDFKKTLPSNLSAGDDGKLLESISITMDLFEAAGKDLQARPQNLQWAVETLEKLIEDLLVIPESMQAEERIRTMVQLRLQEMRRLASQGYGVEEINFNSLLILSYFLEEHLGSSPSSIGKYLGKGVTVAAMRPMRPLPFRMVFVPGMQEGGFPGHPDKSTLDLRTFKRKIGDANRMEKDCYLFLELVTSTREKLILSYINRDLQKDEKYQTCQVLNQLIRCVEADVLAPNDKIPIQEIPLTGYHSSYFEPSRGGHQLANYEVVDRMVFLAKKNQWINFNSLAKEPECMSYLKDYRPSESLVQRPSSGVAENSIILKLSDLTSFLKEPGIAVLKKWYGFYNRPEYARDLAVKEVEPFRSDHQMAAQLEINPILDLLKSQSLSGSKMDFANLEDCLKKNLDRLSLEAKIPLKPYQSVLWRNSRKALEQRVDNFRKNFNDDCKGVIKGLRFLDTESSQLLNLPGILVCEAPEFQVELERPWQGQPPGNYRVKIVGSFDTVYVVNGTSIYFLSFLAKAPKKSVLSQHSLDAFLGLMLLFNQRMEGKGEIKGANFSDIKEYFILEIDTEKSYLHRVDYKVNGDYRVYLKNLLKDFLEHHEPVYFPYKDYEEQIKAVLAGEGVNHHWDAPEMDKISPTIRIANLKFPENPVEFINRRYRHLYGDSTEVLGHEYL